jgi:hypothetical protein
MRAAVLNSAFGLITLEAEEIPAANLLRRICPLLMLWTAPPPALKCHGCGCC